MRRLVSRCERGQRDRKKMVSLKKGKAIGRILRMSLMATQGLKDGGDGGDGDGETKKGEDTAITSKEELERRRRERLGDSSTKPEGGATQREGH